jgi:catechol 2,3-dioxygenase-like lactoylglutathione lyase family enzyme
VITQLEHVALSVADLDRSLAFYRDVLGFDLLRTIDPRDDDKLGRIAGLPGARARIAHLRKGDNMFELFQYVVPEGAPIPAGRRQADHGYIHLGLRSNDARGDFARLREKGVAFLGEPLEFRPGVWVVYFRGPDGEVIELRQDDSLPGVGFPGG